MTPPPSLLLSLLPGIGVNRYWALVNALGSPEHVLNTSCATLPLLNTAAKTLLNEYQQQPTGSALWQSACAIMEAVERAGGYAISIEDSKYPTLLKEIHQPPPVIYVKGNLNALSLPQVAIVGSRHATHTGLKNAALFAQHLSKNGITITSGLALGIDGAAHQATVNALHTNGKPNHHGKTIAVMATGIDRIYPKKHLTLAEEILANNGALVSEFPPATAPKADHFPRRNRIISGLSLGVLVVEAAIKSGSLITAKYAIEQNREVFALPNSIHNPQGKGCNQLIKNGAHLIESSQDIMDHLHSLISHLALNTAQDHHDQLPNDALEKDTSALSPDEQILLELIGFDPKTIDQLTLSCPLSSQQISVALLSLEMGGWIKLSNWGYERV